MAKNIWVDETARNAIDLDAVRQIYMCETASAADGSGVFKVCFEFLAAGYTQIVLEHFGKDDYPDAEDAANKSFEKIVAQWRGGAK